MPYGTLDRRAADRVLPLHSKEMDGDRRLRSWRRFRSDIVVLACAISAGIHAALAPEHFAEGTAAGVGFVVSTVLLTVVAVALTLRPGDAVALAAAAALFAGLLAVYALVVTTGVPVLHPEPEPLDGLALFTKLVEALGLLTASRLLRAPSVGAHLTQPKGTLT
jgi:hypothetical protein